MSTNDNEREFFIPLRDDCIVEGLAIEASLDGRKNGFGEERLKLDFGDERFPSMSLGFVIFKVEDF